MRLWAILLCLLPAWALAQSVGPAVQAALSVIKERLPNPGGPNPLAGPTNPPLGPRPGDLPEPIPYSKRFRIIRAEDIDHRDNGYIFLNGKVEFIYEGYHTFADQAEGSEVTGVFMLRGNVRVEGRDALITGEQVSVDYKQRTYSGRDAEVVLAPPLVGGGIRDNLYTEGGAGFGRIGNQLSYDAGVTTCNIPGHAHYQIKARRTDIRPGKRILLYDTKVRFFGKTRFNLPFIALPLDDRTSRYTPDVGQTQEEGYYVKNWFGVPIGGAGSNTLRARVDYMEKLGQGLGGDYGYQNSNLAGLLRFYSIAQLGQIVFQNQHRQRFGRIEFSFDNDYQQNNYLTAPGSTVLSTRSQLVVPWGGGTTNFTYNRTGSSYLAGNTENQTYSVNDNRTYGRRLNTQFDLNYGSNSSSYTGGTDYSSEQMDLRFRGSQDLTRATANLEYQRTIPIGDTQNFFGGQDRTPVLSLQSDSTRLFGQGFGRSWPLRTELSLGEFSDPLGGRLTRQFFNVDFNKNDRATKRLRVDLNGRFQQGMYSDGTAQYVVGSGSTVAYRLGRDTSANLRYNYLRPEGFSPLSLDSTGKSHVATTDISVRPQKYLLFGGQTGYDFNRAKTSDVGWQQVGLRSEFTPTPFFNLRSLATYDTFNGIWSSVRIDLNYRAGATLLTIGSRYDGFRQQWSNANLYLNNLKIGRTRFSAVLNYNGFTKQFDATQYNAVYDLHCWEAVLTMSEYKTGFRPGKEFQILFRLKALPFDSIFGIGRRGQPLGTGTGRDF